MRLRAACALVFSAGAVLACTAGALDGFSGGADPDAGGGAEDAGIVEASSGGDADTGATLDAGGDASTVCPPTAVFCESFDGTDPLATWAMFTTPNASAGLSSDLQVSSPKSFHTSLDGPATGAKRNAYITRTLGNGTITHAKYSFAIYIESRPAAGQLEICSVRFTSTAGAFNDFYIAIDATSATLQEQHHEPGGSYVAGASSALGTALPTGKWVRVTVEMALADPRSMAMSIDGVEIARTGLALNGPGAASVDVGIAYANEVTAAAAADFDDVAFEVLP